MAYKENMDLLLECSLLPFIIAVSMRLQYQFLNGRVIIWQNLPGKHN